MGKLTSPTVTCHLLLTGEAERKSDRRRQRRCWSGGISPALEIAQGSTLRLPSSPEEERKWASSNPIHRQVEQAVKGASQPSSENAVLNLSKRREVLTLLHPVPFSFSTSLAFQVSVYTFFEQNMVVGRGQMENTRWG